MRNRRTPRIHGRHRPRGLALALATTLALTATPALATHQSPTPSRLAGGPPGREINVNTKLVGRSDLQARSAYQPTIHKYPDGRYIAFVGHHAGQALNPLTGVMEGNGTSIVDVTNARQPVYLRHLVATEGQAQMVQICNGSDLPNPTPAKAGRVFMLRTNGDLEHEVWDVTNPAAPVGPISVPVTGLDGTHKNWWQCNTGIAYLVADLEPEGWAVSRGLKIFDLSDPADPKFIRNFALPGSEPGGSGVFRGGSGIHEPTVSADGTQVILAYGTDEQGVLQILDTATLLANCRHPAACATHPSPADLLLPQRGRLDMPDYWGGHTAWSLGRVAVKEDADFHVAAERHIILLTSESLANECNEAHHSSFVVDFTDGVNPFSIATFRVRESDFDFCKRGGRFGTHSQNWSYTEPWYSRHIVVYSYFNAGARVVDMSDPFHPNEIAYYIPATTANTDRRCVTIAGVQRCKTAIQTNNVEVDDRGNVYLADRANTGLHIVQLTHGAWKLLNTPR
jgi:hypothetical protein